MKRTLAFLLAAILLIMSFTVFSYADDGADFDESELMLNLQKYYANLPSLEQYIGLSQSSDSTLWLHCLSYDNYPIDREITEADYSAMDDILVDVYDLSYNLKYGLDNVNSAKIASVPQELRDLILNDNHLVFFRVMEYTGEDIVMRSVACFPGVPAYILPKVDDIQCWDGTPGKGEAFIKVNFNSHVIERNAEIGKDYFGTVKDSILRVHDYGFYQYSGASSVIPFDGYWENMPRCVYIYPADWSDETIGGIYAFLDGKKSSGEISEYTTIGENGTETMKVQLFFSAGAIPKDREITIDYFPGFEKYIGDINDQYYPELLLYDMEHTPYLERDYTWDEHTAIVTLKNVFTRDRLSALLEEIKAYFGEDLLKVETDESHFIHLEFLNLHYHVFNDVWYGSWFYKAVCFVKKYEIMAGIVKGTGNSFYSDNGIFDPQGNMTRSMFVSVLRRMSGDEGVVTDDFSDVVKGSWYEDSVGWAVKNGITAGIGGGLFAPGREITREEAITLLKKYDEYIVKRDSIDNAEKAEPVEKTEFADADKVSAFAKEAIDWSVDEGIISGITQYGKPHIVPQKLISRAEAAQMIMKYCER